MIETNALLDTRGKMADSFVVLDLMRLPLGILSGMGFIGTGAIIHRGNLVQGLTTAATLWFVTVIGLCFDAGKLRIGTVSTVLGYLVLSLLKRAEASIPIDRRASVEMTVQPDSPLPEAFDRTPDRGGLPCRRASRIHPVRTAAPPHFLRAAMARPGRPSGAGGAAGPPRRRRGRCRDRVAGRALVPTDAVRILAAIIRSAGRHAPIGRQSVALPRPLGSIRRAHALAKEH
jgi:hypothetical protein